MTDLTFGILHFSDRNMQDRYYEVPIRVLKEFKPRVTSDGFEWTWSWFLELKRTGTVKSGALDEHSDVFFLDYCNPLECIEEWDFEGYP